MSSIHEFIDRLAQLDVRLWLDGDKLRCSAPNDVMTDALRNQLAERKAELISLLEDSRTSRDAAADELAPRKQGTIPPLSAGQERLWTLSALRPRSSVYHISTAFFLSGVLSVRLLEQSLTEIERRHEVLRTTFPDRTGTPVQIVGNPEPVVLPAIDMTFDLRPLAPQRAEQEILRTLQAEVAKPFDLETGPLWRALLLKLGENAHVLSLTMHHIIFDGASKVVLLDELGRIYTALSRNREPELPALSIQYADYAAWDRRRLASTDTRQQVAYWRERLKSLRFPARLPIDRPRSSAASPGDHRKFEIPLMLSAQVESTGRARQCSLFVTLLCGFAALLNRYSGQPDIVICSPMAARDRPELEPLIGYFNNVVAIRADLSGNPTFQDLMARLRTISLEALQNQNVPLQEVSTLTESARIPLTRAMFSFQDTSSRRLSLPGVDASPLDVRKAESDFELALYMEKAPDGRLSGIIEYDADLFVPGTIDRLIGNLKSMLRAMCLDSGTRIGDPALDVGSWSMAEHALRAHPQVEQALVLPPTASSGPVAYLVLDEYDVPTLEDIRAFLREALPEHLVPDSFVPLDTFPLLDNGDIDYARLPVPAAARALNRREAEAPRTELESQLAGIWKRVLWLDEDIGVNEHFSDLGGHSLLSVQLVSEVESFLGRQLPIEALTDLSTIANMARCIQAAETADTSNCRRSTTSADGPTASGLSPEIYQGLLQYTASWSGRRVKPQSLIVGLNTDGHRMPLFWCLQRYDELLQLARYLGEDQPVYGMRSGNRVMVKSQDNVDALASHYVGEILETELVGPLLVGGNCQAARIALKVADGLRQLGYRVPLLVLMEKFVAQTYPDRVALLFSADSDRNPYLYFRQPETGWRKYYTGGFDLEMIAGAHMQFFREPNIQVLAAAVERRIDAALACSPCWMPGIGVPAAQRLPPSAYRAEIVPLAYEPSEDRMVAVLRARVTNASPVAWEPYDSSAIALANRWAANDGHRLGEVDGKTALPNRLEPGETIEIDITVSPPPGHESMLLELDMIEEGITWFSSKGSTLSQLPVSPGNTAVLAQS